MNIFILDADIDQNVKMYADKHVVKMILEHAQMLSTAIRETGVDVGYKSTHKNHPCTKWVRESLSNFNWLYNLTEALHDEWQYRWEHSRVHKSVDMIRTLPTPDIKDIGMTPFALAMPDRYRSTDAVVAYREYYKGEKQHLFKWTKRNRPEWMMKK